MDNFENYNIHSNGASNRNSAPILAWDFHYEFRNELKLICEDLKKLDKISNQFQWNTKKLKIRKRINQETILITDLNQKIIFASSKILSMTGYSEIEILGKTPKIFQGELSSRSVLNEMRKAIELCIPFEKIILNHKKNGKIYKCNINCFPVFNLKGELSHFIAFKKEV